MGGGRRIALDPGGVHAKPIGLVRATRWKFRSRAAIYILLCGGRTGCGETTQEKTAAH
jgi:hypothetical protein